MPSGSSKSDLQIRLARRILHMVADGSASRESHLREVELAATFGVSRTPIRASLHYLEDLGALDKRENKGFFVGIDAHDAQKILATLPRSDDEIIKARIARDWFARNISTEVSEGEIRTRYDLGKMTATRILSALCDEGIVSRAPGYGWRFEPTLNSREAHDESYDFRLAVEPGAILDPAFSLDTAQAASLRNRHQQILGAPAPNLPETVRLDEDFHEFIARCSNNRFCLQAIRQHNRLRRLLEYQSLINAGRLAGSCQEHISILDHLEAGDIKAAATTMKRHLQKAKNAAPSFI